MPSSTRMLAERTGPSAPPASVASRRTADHEVKETRLQAFKYAMNFAVAIVAAPMLAGCETLPTATYTTGAGCGIAQWTKEFIQSNVSIITWSGPCQKGLAQGKGTLTMKLKTGKERLYAGEMEKGFISGTGVRTSETGWRYEGTFLWNLFIAGKIYLPSGRLLFDGLMAQNEDFQGKNLTFSDQRYKSGTIYFTESSYVTDGRYTGSAGPVIGLDGIDPKTGKGIIYGKYVQDNVTVYRMVEGNLYPDEISFVNAQGKYYERVLVRQNAQIAAYNKDEEDRKARELREALSRVSGAVTAAAGGSTRAEQRQLALTALAEPVGGGGGAISGGSTVGGLEIISLAPPPGVKSRNECLKIEWITSPLPRNQAGDTRLSEPQYFGNRNYVNQRQLVAYSTCAENLTFVAGACSEQAMLGSGEQVGIHFETEFINRGANTDVRILLAEEYSTRYGRDDKRTAPRKVFVGAWSISDLRNATGYTEGGASHQRKVQALLADARVVLGAAPGQSLSGKSWPPGRRLAGVKSCNEFAAEETWNRTR